MYLTVTMEEREVCRGGRCLQTVREKGRVNENFQKKLFSFFPNVTDMLIILGMDH